MDRYTVNTAKSQIGFIDVIVKPLYEVVKCFLPELQTYIGNLEKNKQIWQGKIDEYDTILSFIHIFMICFLIKLFLMFLSRIIE